MNDLLITFKVIFDEITSFNIIKYIEIIITVLIVTYISKKAQRTIFRLIMSLLGIYFFSAHIGHEHFLFSLDVVVGLSLIMPHIVYWIDYIKRFIQKTIEISTNLFFFIITLYYKIRKFVLWSYNIYLKIRNFLKKRKYEKSKKEYKKKEDKKQNNYYKEQEYSNSYKQDDRSNNKDNSYSKNNEKKNSSYSNNTYEDNSNHNPYGEEFEQFFSNDSYIILGVSRSDDKATIKKAYRKLVMKYHPDINSNDEIKKYTTICQMLNKAYEDIG